MILRTRRLAVAAAALALVFGLISTRADVARAADSSSAPRSAPTTSNPYSPAYGHPYRRGVVPTIAQNRKLNAYARAHQAAAPATGTTNTLSYGGGIDGIGVTSGIPKVYLVFWGSQWGTQSTDSNHDLTFSNDRDSGAPYIQEMFKGLGGGGEQWSGVMTQYCDGSGVVTGATSCASNVAHVGYPQGGALAGVWYDSSAAEPAQATGHQIGQEAVKAAAHFGNTSPTLNRYAQYVILSAPSLDPDQYQENGFCAWHDYNGDSTLSGGAVISPYGDIAFTNMPYVMDAGSGCGAGTVTTPGTLDGYSIVAGHEYAETLTDQNPTGGWSNNDSSSQNFGSENADECAWLTSGQGAMADVTLGTGSFPMQSTWSNDTNQCSLSHQIILNDLIRAVSGNSQSATVAGSYAKPIEVAVTDPYGTPLQNAAVTFTAPTSGATVTFASPCSGNTCVITTDTNGDATSPSLTSSTTAGSFTVTAADPTTVNPVSFNLTNTAGSATHMSLVSGDSQSAPAGTAYSSPLRVAVTDQYGNAVSGTSVNFSAPSSGPSATFASCAAGNPQPYQCNVTSDSQGHATSSVMTAGGNLGTFNPSATSAGLTPVSFSLTNLTGPAKTVVPDSGSGQSAPVGGGFANPLQVTVADQFGNPVSGARVTFSAPSSGASATFAAPCSGTSCVVTTAADGSATSPSLTAGTKAGSFTVTASAPPAPSPGSFTLTDLAGVPSQMTVVAGNSQSAAVESQYAIGLEVKVADGFGNPISGVPVTFTAPASGASVTFGSCPGGNPSDGCVVSTDSQGIATSSLLKANSTTGTFTVAASASGAGSRSFSLTNVIGSPALIAVSSGSGQSALAGGNFAGPLQVTVTDQFGDPVPGASVTFSAPSSGPTVTFAACAGGNPTANQCVASTDGTGTASSSPMTASSSPGSFSVAVGVSGVPTISANLTNLQSGYYLVASDGGIFNFGGAPFEGSEGGSHLNAPVVGMAAAPAGGYYLVASDGGIFNFGGAPYYGSTGGMHLNKPIVGMAVAPSGGYYLVASDGGIFNFGPGATFYGSEGGAHLNAPIVGMAVAPGGGYYLVASDGGIFNFGPGATFYGSTGGMHLNKPIVGMSVDPATGGYWLDASDGGIFNFNAPFYGSEGGTVLNKPMVGMAPSAVQAAG